MAVSVSWRDPPSPEGADMFVPPVTEAHTEAAANTTSKPATSQPAHIARPCGGGAFKDAPTLRPSLGNQTMLRRLVRPATNVIGYERGGNSRQYAEPAHLTAEATRPDIGWCFSKVPTFSPDRATRSNHVPPYAAARTAEAVVPLLDVGAVSVPAVHVEGPHEDEERPAPAPENATEAAAAPPATPTPPEVAKEAVPQIAVVPAQPKPMSLEHWRNSQACRFQALRRVILWRMCGPPATRGTLASPVGPPDTGPPTLISTPRRTPRHCPKRRNGIHNRGPGRRPSRAAAPRII